MNIIIFSAALWEKYYYYFHSETENRVTEMVKLFSHTTSRRAKTWNPVV